MAKLELKNIKKSFGDAHILKGIDPVSYTHLDVYKRQGQCCALVHVLMRAHGYAMGQ